MGNQSRSRGVCRAIGDADTQGHGGISSFHTDGLYAGHTLLHNRAPRKAHEIVHGYVYLALACFAIGDAAENSAAFPTPLRDLPFGGDRMHATLCVADTNVDYTDDLSR